MKLIWPAKILKSWGSSSKEVLRRKDPHLVIIASLSFGAKSLGAIEGASIFMERNFSNVNFFSFLPKRICRYSAGPFEVQRVIMAKTSIGKPNSKIPTKEPPRSMRRLKQR